MEVDLAPHSDDRVGFGVLVYADLEVYAGASSLRTGPRSPGY
jgi:hypothetical protein